MIRRRDGLAVLDVRELHEMFVEPLAVRLFPSDLRFDFIIGNDAALLHVHDEHAARLQASFRDDVLRRDRQHARFARHDHEVVLRHIVARGAQAIAIQRRADHRAIGERDRRRPVPRLHDARVVFVERLLLLAHGLMPGPRLGNHHHHRMRQRAPALHKQLEHIVEHRGIRSLLIHDGQDFLHVIEERAVEQRFARLHPVDVPAQRVDFAVVRDVAVRMRTLPARERVCGKTRVHERERALHVRVRKVEKIRADLLRHQHPFVHQRAAREARRIPERIHARRADRAVRELAQHV